MDRSFVVMLCMMAALGMGIAAQDDLVTDFTTEAAETPLVTRGDYVLRGTALVQYLGKTEQDLVVPPDLGITEIGDDVFLSNKLLSVVIPEGVTKLGTHAFKDCYNLVSVRIPKTLTEIGAGAFTECGRLKEVRVDRDNPAYRDVEGVLLSRDLSTLVYYPAGKETSEYRVPNGVKTIQERAFQGTNGLISLYIPAGVIGIGNNAFFWCRSLTTIRLPEGLNSIGNYAFSWCSSLTTINLPAGLTTIGNYAFYGCGGLTTVDLPEGLTAIGDYTFSWCSSLTTINLPAGLTSIGDGAFSGCSSLTAITVEALNPPSLTNGLWYSWSPAPAVIHVPASAVDAYKNAEGWKNHADKIQAR